MEVVGDAMDGIVFVPEVGNSLSIAPGQVGHGQDVFKAELVSVVQEHFEE
jgi:hypothetical protein